MNKDHDTQSRKQTTSAGSARANLFASYLGRFWFILIAIACTPYFVRQLGPDGYGLVGFFLTLQRLAVLLDAGFSTTINREIAQQTVKPSSDSRIPDMLRTLEIAYWTVSLLLLACFAAASEWISHHWLQNETLTPAEVKSLVLLMGLAIAIQLPHGFYSAALMGQERHVLLNVIRVSWHTVRFLGAVLVLMLVAPTPIVFFSWQLLSAVLVTLATAMAIWRSMYSHVRSARFRPQLLREVSAFTAGAGIFTITAALITQMDKLVLSNQLSAEQFGYYMLAYSIPSALFIICSPIYSVVFPKLAKHIAQNDAAGLKRSYHFGSQLTTLTILPVAVTGAFFSREILEAWLSDPAIASQCYLPTRYLFCGIAVSCLCSMPHALQMAYGWTRLANGLNLLALTLLVPAYVWSCSRFGTLGASVTWLVYSSIYLLLQVQLMHRKLLPEDKLRWLRDIARPLLVLVVVAGIARMLLHPIGRLEILATVAVTWGICVLGAALACSEIRNSLSSYLGEKRSRRSTVEHHA